MGTHPLGRVAEFLDLLYRPRSAAQAILSRRVSTLSPVVSIFMLVVVIAATNWITLTDRELIQDFLSSEDPYMATEEELVRSERVREATLLGLDQRGVVLTSSVTMIWQAIRTLAILCFLLAVVFSFLEEGLELIPRMVELACLSTIILSLGIIVHTGMRYYFRSFTAVLSPAFFVHPFDHKDALHLSMARLDLFTIWYLVCLSLSLAAIYKENLLTTVSMTILIWVVLQLIGLVVGADFSFFLTP